LADDRFGKLLGSRSLLLVKKKEFLRRKRRKQK